MKLRSKFALFNALSRILILLLFVGVVPPLLSHLALVNTDQRLREQREKVLKIIYVKGLSEFIEGGEESTYGSYNLLKEEFISLEEIGPGERIEKIENTKRAVEEEVVQYRVLSYSFIMGGKNYLLEIGRSVATIGETESIFREYALYLLLIVVVITTLSDIVFAHYLLRPLNVIIKKRLEDVQNPSSFNFDEIRTSTSDFRHLDDSILAMMTKIHESFSKEREFIANASHELLTPISVLQHRLENMLADENLSDTHLLKLIESQKTLSRLKNIIRTLLLISKIENNQFPCTETISVSALLEEISEETEDRLSLKSICLQKDLQQDHVVSAANRSLLFTMLFNLVNNAIKYNKANGTIHIVGKYVDRQYTLEIRDTGVGMEKEQLALIFDRFKKLSPSDQESFGLGLPIVKTIAQLHKIEIEVNSIPGVGTSFRLLFPMIA